MAGTQISPANSTIERKYPRWKVYAVRSPTAVPSAKVATTAAQ